MFRHLPLALALSATLALPVLAQDSKDKNLDIQSSVGDLHVGSDADARKAGLPLYPGARIKTGTSDGDTNQANLSLFTEAFGFKLVISNYESDDAPAKIIDFYRDKLKKYGKVLECHTQKHGGNVEVHDDDDKDSKDKKSKELKCDENSGPVTELKVGTEDNQHAVAIEPRDGGKGSTFAVVYVHARGKQGDI
ncbi:MAG TPA: hypothetical protein VK812_21120 [Candidatus Binatus sp.]|nr:hypothetical protein [Candidatus Binatus sp.]